MMIRKVLEDADFPEDVIRIVKKFLEHADDRDFMEGGYVQAGKEMVKGFKSGKFFGPGAIICNTYPGVPGYPLTEQFIGLSFGTDKLTKLLAAYADFLSAHCNKGTKNQIYAVLITDKWSDSDYKKYKTLINNLSGALKVKAAAVLVLEQHLIRIPATL